MTDAMAAGRFPTDEPLSAVGRRQLSLAIDFGATEFTSLSGPELRCLQTAELLGLRAAVEPRLADLDCGRWRGDVLGGVLAADLAVWLTDPTSAPHGGESVVDLMDRVAGWLESLTAGPSRTVAVTPPAGDPGRDPVGPRCAAKVVLARRYRAGQSDRDALSRPRLDPQIHWLSA